MKRLKGLQSYKRCPHLNPLPQEEDIRRAPAQRLDASMTYLWNVVTFLTFVTLT
jgi:hypothetical protein